MEKPSRTQQKKKAQDLQKIGERLLDLPDSDLKSLDIPQELKTALLTERTMTRHGAKRRQRQFIGALMRTIDPEPVLAAVARLDMNREMAARHFQEMEAWRDRLISPPKPGMPPALKRFMTEFPHADRQRLSQLIRNRVKAQGTPKQQKTGRALFQYIREIMDNTATAREL